MQYVSLIGATLTLIAYFMVSNNKWSPRSVVYQLTNLTSSCILGYVAVTYQDPGFMMLNFVWGAIGLWALIRIMLAYANGRRPLSHSGGIDSTSIASTLD